jgi:hypothetical protein
MKKKSKKEHKSARLLGIYGGLVFLSIIFIYILVSFLSFQTFAQIRTINLTGLKRLDSKKVLVDIEKITHATRFGSISANTPLTIPHALIETTLRVKYPQIHTITFPQLFTKDVYTIKIVEKEIAGVWCADEVRADTCFYVDHTGFLFEQGALGFGTLRITGGVQDKRVMSTIGEGFFTQLDELAQGVQVLSMTPAHVHMSDDGHEIDMALLSGLHIRMMTTVSTKETLRYLKSALNSSTFRDKLGLIEYIDLRYGNRIFYKER